MGGGAGVGLGTTMLEIGLGLVGGGAVAASPAGLSAVTSATFLCRASFSLKLSLSGLSKVDCGFSATTGAAHTVTRSHYKQTLICMLR